MTMDEDKPRLIEKGFPLEQTSIESLHEKMCHSGHIKAIHIWPARRPLAACRAAIVTSLLLNPNDLDERNKIFDLLAGKVIEKNDKSGKNKKITIGGVLRWKSENAESMDVLRDLIKKNYPGEPPRLLDPFAGGGAIPFEGMRAGCEVTAMDINPVAWFILKCTLEYPQKFSGKIFPMPEVLLQYREPLLESNSKNKIKKKGQLKELTQLRFAGSPELPLASHVRSWSEYILHRVQENLIQYYPTSTNETIVSYLWTRTVTCKNCRAEIPLLKSLWLGHNSNNRTLVGLKAKLDHSGVDFEIINNVPILGATKNEKTENDKRMGKGTMSKSGAWCPCCGRPGTIAMTTDDIRQAARANMLGQRMYAVVYTDNDTEVSKKFRLATPKDLNASMEASDRVIELFKNIPFGIPDEPLPSKEALGFRIPLYGFDRWYKLFTPRQLLCLGTFIQEVRQLKITLRELGYPEEWVEAITCYLACIIDKLADYNSAFVHWQPAGPKGGNTFMRWAFPMKTDFVENALLTSKSGGWADITDWVIKPLSGILQETTKKAPAPHVILGSAKNINGDFDIIITDPPYYDAIPYSDLMDFFYVWLRRTLTGLNPEFDRAFSFGLSPKWDIEREDGELIDDSSRFDGDEQKSKRVYEEGMGKTFSSMYNVLKPDGRLVLVFAHKDPNAWETLVTALIKSGFVVNGSWPIQTEMSNRTRSQGSAALSSSVWMVCRKRLDGAIVGWDNRVLEEMRNNIFSRLREYWDAGIRGPDFIWAATGPALEAYSKHPIVKKADDPGQIMTVTEFLIEVRRIVIDFVVGRVLGEEGERDRDLDNITAYYLLHRHDFGFGDAPAGSCILYAVSCDLSDSSLAGENDILLRSGGMEEPAEEEGEETEDDFIEEGTSSTFRLKAWNKRKSKSLGMDNNGRPAPMIDRVHKLMQLWKEGDMAKVDEYLDSNGLLKNKTFHHILQAIIELSKEGDEERSLLESISNHILSRGGAVSAPKDLSYFGG